MTLGGKKRDYSAEDPERFLATAKSFLVETTKRFDGLSPQVHRPADHDKITVYKVEVDKTDEWFLSKVLQPAGCVIESHRHLETHVLVEIVCGRFWIECEGYGRLLTAGERTFFPAGFSHTVIALEDGSTGAASFWSIHHLKELATNQAQFLGRWPKERTELAVCHSLLKCFLLMQSEALTDTPTLKAWFYLIHYDKSGLFEPTEKELEFAIGFVGSWSDQERTRVREEYRPKRDSESETVFRHGKLLRERKVAEVGVYPWLYVASPNAALLNELVTFSDLHSVRSGAQWQLTMPSELAGWSHSSITDPFQQYMDLVCGAFLPATEIFFVVTPPQQPGNVGFVEDVQRVSSSSIVVGMNCFNKTYVAALIPFCILISAVLQQARFAVTDDLTDIRLNDQGRRTRYFVEVVLAAMMTRAVESHQE